jgi:hypothetical protein
LLGWLLSRCKKDGHLLIKLQNPFDVITAFQTMGAKVELDLRSGQKTYTSQLGITELIEFAKRRGYKHKEIVVENWPLDEPTQENLKNLIRNSGFGNENPKEVFSRAMVRYYLIDLIAA